MHPIEESWLLQFPVIFTADIFECIWLTCWHAESSKGRNSEVNPVNTFLWHDYETFGANPIADRPAQFAAIRTDEEF